MNVDLSGYRGYFVEVEGLLGTDKAESLSGGDRPVQVGALAKTRLTPTVEDAFNQVVGDGAIFGNMLMALLALPRVLMNSCYLFEHSSHCFDGKAYWLPTPFNQSVQLNSAIKSVRYIQTHPT